MTHYIMIPNIALLRIATFYNDTLRYDTQYKILAIMILGITVLSITQLCITMKVVTHFEVISKVPFLIVSFDNWIFYSHWYLSLQSHSSTYQPVVWNRCHDTQHNDIQHNDTKYSNTLYNDTLHYDTQYKILAIMILGMTVLSITQLCITMKVVIHFDVISKVPFLTVSFWQRDILRSLIF